MRRKDEHCLVRLPVCLLVAFGFVAPAAAQDKYPSKPVSVIVPTPPGGGTDILTRQLAEVIEPILGTKLVVENKPGGGGTVGTTVITQARPDGYTLGMIWNGPAHAAGAVHRAVLHANHPDRIKLICHVCGA